MAAWLPTDRRRETRITLDRPVKLQSRRTGKYYHGRTADVSPAGLMIEIDLQAPIVSGESVGIGVGWSSQHMLLQSNNLVDCTVVRSLGLEGRQRVAVQFDHRQQLALSA